jgi:hypothetical protein
VQAAVSKRVALDFYLGIGGRNATVRTNNKELEELWKKERRSFVAIQVHREVMA